MDIYEESEIRRIISEEIERGNWNLIKSFLLGCVLFAIVHYVIG